MSDDYLEVPKGYSVKWADARWTYKTPDGDEGGKYSNLDQCVMAAERHFRQSQIVRRPCISCQAPMKSEGPHHRMCDRCRRDGEWRGV